MWGVTNMCNVSLFMFDTVRRAFGLMYAGRKVKPGRLLLQESALSMLGTQDLICGRH